jgi:hypothetical protein
MAAHLSGKHIKFPLSRGGGCVDLAAFTKMEKPWRRRAARAASAVRQAAATSATMECGFPARGQRLLCQILAYPC